MSDSSLGKQLFRGATYLYLAQLLSIPLGIVTSLLLGRFVIPADYGAFAIATMILGFTTIVTDARLVTVLVRHETNPTHIELSSVFWFQLIISFVIGLLIAAGTYLYDAWAPPTLATDYLRTLLIILPLNAFITVPMMQLERGIAFRKIAVAAALWDITERIVLIALIASEYGGYSFVISRIFGVLLQGISLAFISPWRVQLAAFSRQALRPLLKFGYTLGLKDIAGHVGQGSIPAIGGRLLGGESVGLAQWSHNTAATVGLALPKMACRVLTGASSHLRHEQEQLRTFAAHTVLITTVLTATIMAVSAALMPELITFFFNAKWQDASVLYPWSALVMAVSALYLICDAIVIILGRPGIAVKADWSWAVVTASASLALTWWLGLPGLLIAHLCGTAAALSILIPRIQQMCPLPLVRSWGFPLGVAGITYYLSLILKTHFVKDMLSLIVFGAIGSAAGLALQAVSNPRLITSALGWWQAYNARHEQTDQR